MVSDWFVASRINGEVQGEVFKKYLVTWTPTVIIMDTEGRGHFRFNGFLSPRDLSARLILDGAKTELNLGNFSLATKCFDEVVEKYPDTFAVPEATYYLAAARFLADHEPKILKESLQQLKDNFPDSEWILRSKPYELIGK